jgi:hypothetical protein
MKWSFQTSARPSWRPSGWVERLDYFCTLFNEAYFLKGMALIHSLLERATGPWTLYVLSMDGATHEKIRNLRLSNVISIDLSEFENPELLKVKADRSLTEYCWTCTPAIIRFCINRFSLPECTYLDADLYFFDDPGILLQEVRASGKSVLITPHHYTWIFDQTKYSGIFCVQFMYFKADAGGHKVLEHWYNQCIEWCYARVEPGRFGDQKYLDTWPQEFASHVHVLKHLGAGAPWNIQRYRVLQYQDRVKLVTPSAEFEMVFYHFHGFHQLRLGGVFYGWYPLDDSVRKHVYAIYESKLTELARVYPGLYSLKETWREGRWMLKWLRMRFWMLFLGVLRDSR